MISLTSTVRAPLRRWCVVGAVVAIVLGASTALQAQVVQGVQQGAQAGNKAAGPVGGVLGGAIGGVVGVFTGVLGVGRSGQAVPPPSGAGSAKQTASPKAAKASKAGKGTKQAVLTQQG